MQGYDRAFPVTDGTAEKYELALDERGGLTKREYFAAMALSGMIANYSEISDGDNTVAVTAVRLADRLIDALNK